MEEPLNQSQRWQSALHWQDCCGSSSNERLTQVITPGMRVVVVGARVVRVVRVVVVVLRHVREKLPEP